jgi:hypothetical protein
MKKGLVHYFGDRFKNAVMGRTDGSAWGNISMTEKDPEHLALPMSCCLARANEGL